ncbi:hypothetical protein FHS59_000110 [Algoriphagus iocasae]|uniref:Uncharacterized protein n=1 Tax=Algoriphagus iocasae TaxID=1836499 RepID=A0A841MPL0_9BACT|nr:hypothetical protein [Algoriphagus iocasae]MBB6324495.1 hypothetical protein [Algoriphagus iocasae]
MLENISWGNFLLCVAGLSLLYYGYIVVRYFRGDLIKYLRHRGNPKPDRVTIELSDEEYFELFEELQNVIRDVEVEILPQSESKEDFLENVRHRLEHFRGKSVPIFHRTLAAHLVTLTQDKPWDMNETGLQEFLAGL